MIYLDSAATSLLKPREVSSAVLKAMGSCAGVGRGGHKPAMEAAKIVYACREEAAALFDAQPEQVVFTLNATHGLNLAINSLCKPGMPVVLSGFEHNAVLRPLAAKGAQLLIAGERLFDPEEAVLRFEQALRKGAKLAVCTCCSNVFGYVLPTDRIAELCRSYGVPLILDASQAAGSLPVSLKRSGAAFIAMPGHKGLYGPQGTGILLCSRKGEPLLYGGTGTGSEELTMPDFLPERLEAGTHNVCGIAGLLAGIRYIRRRKPEVILQKERRLLKKLKEGLERIPSVILYAGKEQAGVLSFRVEGKDSEELAQALGAKGIAVRAGLHCAPLAHKSGGTFPAGTIRMSLCDKNTEEELERALWVCKKLFA